MIWKGRLYCMRKEVMIWKGRLWGERSWSERGDCMRGEVMIWKGRLYEGRGHDLKGETIWGERSWSESGRSEKVGESPMLWPDDAAFRRKADWPGSMPFGSLFSPIKILYKTSIKYFDNSPPPPPPHHRTNSTSSTTNTNHCLFLGPTRTRW